MRIAVIGTRGKAGPARDGIDTALGEIWGRLARRGHHIDVFSERNGQAIAPIDGARVIHLPSLPIALGEASAHAVLSALVSAWKRYDVVNFVSADPGGLFTLAAKLGSHRTVVSVQSLDRPALPTPGTAAAAARFADAIIVSSKGAERLFREAYGREAIFIPNGVSPMVPPPTAAAHLAAMDLVPGSYVLLADRLNPASGAHLAVAGAEALPLGLRLVIAETGEGDDEYRHSLWQNADCERVMFVGQVAPLMFDALMAHAYMAVLPAANADEAPSALLSAMAHGRAVLVGDGPEVMEIIGAEGFTFTSGDAGDLKRVLAWLSTDPEVVERMGKRAAAAITSRYCWDRVADAYEQVYTAIL